MADAKTLFEKVWRSHAVVTREDGATLLWIDRHFVHEGSFHAFGMLDHAGRPVSRPDLTFGVADHYVPSHSRALPIRDPEVAGMLERLRGNARRNRVDLLDIDDERQGIVHVAGPEQGLTLPGLTVVCGDSHTSTHGAFGALGFGIGASEVSHVLATQTLWQHRPIDLPAQTIALADGNLRRFTIDAFRKRRLVEGLDDIGLTLEHQAAIAAFQERDRSTRPWATPG